MSLKFFNIFKINNESSSGKRNVDSNLSENYEEKVLTSKIDDSDKVNSSTRDDENNIESDLDISVKVTENENGDLSSGKKRKLDFKSVITFLKNKFRLDIIDKYILKKFLGTYFLATLLFLAVIAMFDITEKLDAFLTAPLKETIFDYFFSFLPYFANQLSPLFVFISVIFFTTKMAGNSEIIAILSSGISFKRMVRPYMLGAAVIALLTLLLSNYIIPPTNVNRIEYTNKYVKNKKVESGVNIQFQVQPGVVALIGRFEDRTKTGYRFTMDKFVGKEIVSHLTANSITYDTTKNYSWILRDYMIRDFNGMNETIKRGSRLDTIIPVEPRDFLISVEDQETLTTPQLSQFVEKQKMRGVANIMAFEIEKERRIATTAAAFILTLIGVSLSSKKSRGGMGLNIGIGLTLSFSYILFSTVTSTFALKGLTSPVVAMEIPNIVYLIIGLILYYRASKY